jgi:steroid delta-isomerase-like uncharacterized protein
MSDLASIARDYFDAWNRRDWARYKELMHSDYSYTGGDGQRMDGADAGVGVGQMFAAAFPDGRINIKQVYAAGNAVTIEFVGEGTHTGDFTGVPPSGRKVSIPVCDVLEIRDGKIHSEHEYIDMLSMMQQIGAIPLDWVKYVQGAKV